ncbi:hotdog fold domain-containing protein [Tomitella cavernea]|uniref:hotdog fold domain-containing protein n=1 Tax=Tomitella cavernea TaxID=1387982 RepID=UPI00190693C3|nr:hotdog fold domain-containing protein [Tomitella cavernea]
MTALPVDGPTPVGPTYALRKRLPSGRLGDALFSVGLCARVPYFATVLPTVKVMEPGRCEVTAPKWWGIHNHLGTFHAIAACNLAEIAMGMLCEATVPTTHRWIPKSMEVEYLAKATTGLRAIAELATAPAVAGPGPESDTVPDFDAIAEGTEMAVPVRILDRSGKLVVRARITTWVTAR